MIGPSLLHPTLTQEQRVTAPYRSKRLRRLPIRQTEGLGHTNGLLYRF